MQASLPNVTTCRMCMLMSQISSRPDTILADLMVDFMHVAAEAAPVSLLVLYWICELQQAFL